MEYLYELQTQYIVKMYSFDIDGLVQDCSNSSGLAMELLQSCTKPSMYSSQWCEKRLSSI